MFRSLVVGAAVFAAAVVVAGSALGMQRAFAGTQAGGTGARGPTAVSAPYKDQIESVCLHADAGTFPGGPGPVDAAHVGACRDTEQPMGSLWVYNMVGEVVVCDGGWLGFQGIILDGYGTAAVDVTVPTGASLSGVAEVNGNNVDDCSGIWEPTSLSGSVPVAVRLEGGDGRIHEVYSQKSSTPWGDYTWQGKTRGAFGAGDLSVGGPAQVASGSFYEHQGKYTFKAAPEGSMTGMKFISAMAEAAAGTGTMDANNDSFKTAYVRARWQEQPLSAPAPISPPEPFSEPVRVRYGDAFAQETAGQEGMLYVFDMQGVLTDCGGYTGVRGLKREGTGPASVAVQGMRSATAEGTIKLALFIVDCEGETFIGMEPMAISIQLDDPSESMSWKSNVVVTFPDGSGYHSNNMSRQANGAGEVFLGLAEIAANGWFGTSRSSFQYHE